ncbi:class I SAM-dependent methyltransferase [Nocardia sp. NPDC004604]|uniref:class I SAM-dependent methyltransferase n=1 Tax=Nocardia sp. NPDC004604 TaxID=3157013 RepID=UPI0033A832A1
MTKDHPHSVIHAMGNRHDYLPAAGRDALLPGYDLLTRLLGMHKLHETLVAQAELAPGQRVLEIGCGTGNLTIRAKRAQPAAELIGSDPDPLALARAERKAHGLNGIRFERAYAQELPYAEGEFDRLLSAMMLHHLDTDIKTAALAEALRVLRPGGSLHIVDVGGAVTPDDGLVARLMLHNEHAADNLGDGIPQLLRSVGFDSAVVASQRHRRLGRVTFYRGIRPI